MLDHLKANLGEFIAARDLGEIANIIDYTRGLRALRQEGWKIELKREKGTTWYRLNSLIKSGTGRKREYVDKKTRYKILQRDNSTCQRCGKTKDDKVRLHIDHKVPVDWGGESEENNLWTLCSECNEGKQAFFNDFDAETMRAISKLSSGGERLLEYIRRHYGEPIPVYVLQVVARTREWTRELRRLRQNGCFNYNIDRKNWTYTFQPKRIKPSN